MSNLNQTLDYDMPLKHDDNKQARPNVDDFVSLVPYPLQHSGFVWLRFLEVRVPLPSYLLASRWTGKRATFVPSVEGDAPASGPQYFYGQRDAAGIHCQRV
jgi:hypothetical protein